MKIFCLFALIFSFNVGAEDCAKLLGELEKSVDQTEQLLERSMQEELSTLTNIFDPKIRGPHQPYIENNKAFFYQKLVPIRKNINKAVGSDFRSLIKRLKSCQQTATHCGEEVNATSRGLIKPKSLEAVDNVDRAIKTMQK